MTERTGGKRIDYSILHRTGEVVYKDDIVLPDHSDDPCQEGKRKLSISLPLGSTPNNDNERSIYESSNESSFQNYRDSHILISDESEDSSGEQIISDEESEQLHQQNMENLKVMLEKLKIEEGSIAEDIDDFLDENPIEDVNVSVEDIDTLVNKAENLRSSYRGKYKEIVNYSEVENDEDKQAYDKRMDIIKVFIKDAKTQRNHLKNDEFQMLKHQNDVTRQKLDFLGDEARRLMKGLEDRFNVNISESSDEDVVKRKSNLSFHLKDIQSVMKIIQEIMEGGEIRDTINHLRGRYDDVVQLKTKYVNVLDDEIAQREIEKHKTFNKALLGIEMTKFKGYESSSDIYTFKDEFEKLHLRSTPKGLLPHILRNKYLEDPARLIVKEVNDIEEVWRRLKEAYGDHHILLSKKLEELSKVESTWRSKDPNKTVEVLSRITSIIKDLMSLAERHDIENKLYYGNGLDRIYRMLGDSRLSRWLSIAGDYAEGKDQWMKLLVFLEKELKISQQKATISAKAVPSKPKDSKNQYQKNADQCFFSNDNSDGTESETRSRANNTCCYICGDLSHIQTSGPGGSKIVQYFACEKFAEMKPLDRFKFLKSKGYCIQCLLPGASQNQGKHKEGHCQRDYVCKHPSHSRYPAKKHILICEEHKSDPQNEETLQKFKERCINKQIQLQDFSKKIKISHHCSPIKVSIPTSMTEQISDAMNSNENSSTTSIISSQTLNENAHANNNVPRAVNSSQSNQSLEDMSAIYMLQTVKIDEHLYNIFYDNGCGDFVTRYSAIRRIGKNATQEKPGPIDLGGVGNIVTRSPYGSYTVTLPLANGLDAKFTGTCLEQVTQTFPNYPLQGKVEEDIRRSFHESGGNLHTLPKLPLTVGGCTDFMIGIKYNRYFPQEIYKLPSGLAIYRSHFSNVDGSLGVIGGPHKIFKEIELHHHLSSSSFISSQQRLFQNGFHVNPDISLLGFKDEEYDPDISSNSYKSKMTNRLKTFNKAEEAGSEINFRCMKCRHCKDCKNFEHNETLSIREEVEQDLINKSVTTDIDNHQTIARLPLTADPTVKLAPNYPKALKIYKQQIKAIEGCIEDKLKIIEAEKKLHDLGFVEFVKNLPEPIQKMLKEHIIQNFIPWRIVWKLDSITSPLRLVFDGTYPTDSGYSINDIVAKGRNSLNKLVEVFMRWRSNPIAFHNDIQKMYNAVKLDTSDWCLQRYLWQENLDSTKVPEEKVIKTLIYGIRSSGNQAERGIRQIAEICKEEYREVHEIISRDVYVDDIMSGSTSADLANQRMDELEIVLSRGGFNLKGFTISGNDPDKSLSKDGKSILVAGHVWHSRDDKISLNIKELNFSKKKRGRRAEMISEIPSNLTRTDCVSKVGEIFDISGIMTPIIATFKLDLHELVVRKLSWKDTIPNDLLPIWKSHFEMMSEIKEIRYSRAVIPIDAVDFKCDTLDFGDASQNLVCVAIYVRFKRKNGEFSCQLLFSRSRLVPEGYSQPRAELYAALINAHAGEVVRRSLSKIHSKHIKFTDSQIALHWICNVEKSLELWVRNRVVEIHRFTDVQSWQFVKSENMIADIGTRQCLAIDVVDPDSTWINGFSWMKEDEANFPMWTAQELTKSASSISSNVNLVRNEETTHESDFDKVRDRYIHSQYFIDPNLHTFTRVVRLIAILFSFIRKVRLALKGKIKKYPTSCQLPCGPFYFIIPEEDLKKAELYFYRKGSSEVRKFAKPEEYSKISYDSDGILKYTGRILPSNELTIIGRATEVMKDLSSTTFNVPILDRYSPVSYSIVNDIHWNHETANHCGVETVWRYVLQKVYILKGKSMVEKISKSCERCRFLKKKSIEVSMGAISRYNLMIAPAFYVSQVDIAGPFNAYSPHNKRATIKIWYLVFCCATTSATSIKVMESYATTAFIHAFMRFSCDSGYPKTLLIDEGSQLVKGCETMKLNFWDCKFQLHRDVNVDFEVAPVGGHNFNGKVERKIREIKKSIIKAVQDQRLSLMQWETLGATIANSINNMPLALGNSKSNLEFLDLLTPNRLRLGRNNERSPEGNVTVSDYNAIVKENEKIFNAWFEVWLTAHVPKLVEQSKWFKSEQDIQKGDIVLFLKQESNLGSKYQYGMVESADVGRDGKIRKVKVKYRNHTEGVDRTTYRSVRSLVIIRRVDESSIMEELGEIGKYIENKRLESVSEM